MLGPPLPPSPPPVPRSPSEPPPQPRFSPPARRPGAALVARPGDVQAGHGSAQLGTAPYGSAPLPNPRRSPARPRPARGGAEPRGGEPSRAEPCWGAVGSAALPPVETGGEHPWVQPTAPIGAPRGSRGWGEHGRSQHRGDAPRSPPRARLGSSTGVAPMAPIACGAPGMAAAAVMVGKQSSVLWQRGVRTGGAAAITARGRGVQEGQ